MPKKPDNILSAIRFTQLMALMEDKTDPTDPHIGSRGCGRSSFMEDRVPIIASDRMGDTTERSPRPRQPSIHPMESIFTTAAGLLQPKRMMRVPTSSWHTTTASTTSKLPADATSSSPSTTWADPTPISNQPHRGRLPGMITLRI